MRRQDDWSSVAYFYLDRPEDDLPSIDPPEERMKGGAWGGPTLVVCGDNRHCYGMTDKQETELRRLLGGYRVASRIEHAI